MYSKVRDIENVPHPDLDHMDSALVIVQLDVDCRLYILWDDIEISSLILGAVILGITLLL